VLPCVVVLEQHLVGGEKHKHASGSDFGNLDDCLTQIHLSRFVFSVLVRKVQLGASHSMGKYANVCLFRPNHVFVFNRYRELNKQLLFE